MSNNLKIIFCLPGKSFSNRFLVAWTDLLHHCAQKDYKTYLSQKSSANIYHLRSALLGADVRRGEDQKPFNGELDYTHIMWIDSDIYFTPNDFEKLLSSDKDICSGLYKMGDGREFAAVREWDLNKIESNGSFEFLTPDDLSTELMEVAYTGFGFLLVKKGVFEKIKYPWFGPKYSKVGQCYDFASEDASFCLRAAEAGFKIFINPSVRVLHEKPYLF